MKSKLKKKKNKMPVKHICEKCKHIEHYSIFGFIVHIIISVLAGFGIVMIAMLVYAGPSFFSTMLINVETFRYAELHATELRQIGLNLTTVDGKDAFIVADQVAENIGRVRYVIPSPFNQLQDPLYTKDNGGDCKNTAMLFSSIMLNLGYDARVDCDVSHRHCVTRIKSGEYYMIVDLAADFSYVFHNKDSFWGGDKPTWSKQYIRKNSTVNVDNMVKEIGCAREIKYVKNDTVCERCLDRKSVV